MKIAMFTDAYTPRVNGVAVSVQSYAVELCRLGHSVCVVCPDYIDNHTDTGGERTVFKTYRYEQGHKDYENFTVLRIPADNIIWSKEDRNARMNQWSTVKHQMDEFHPDVVHVNSEFLMGWYGVTYARHRHVALVFTFHTLWEYYLENYVHIIPAPLMQKIGRDIVRFYLKRADEIIVPTPDIQDVVKRYHIDRPSDILPTGIPENVVVCDKDKLNEFKQKFYEEKPELKDKKILLYVGRVVKEKNLDFLYDVLEQTLKTVPNAALLFVGGGPELEPLQETASKLPYKDSIFFTGYRPREELVYYYHLSSIFAFPSVTETQGLVTVEAMMTGLPVVAIGERGTIDVMQGDNGGFMVKNDLQDFTNRVVQLLTDSELHQAKSKEAMEWSSKWSMRTLTPQLVELYKKGISLCQEHRKNHN